MNNLYFKQLEVGHMANFVYLIGDLKSKQCAMVDPAWDVGSVLRKAEADGMKITAGLLTHTHFDHANGVEELIRKTGCKIYVHKDEAKYLKEFTEHIVETHDGMKIRIGEVELEVLHTPGHTEGAQCFLSGDILLSGDTLFPGACGRCDLPGGDERKMAKSLKRLSGLDEKIRVYSGHAYGEASSSTIGIEKRNNPFMQKAWTGG
ncbi:MAG: putative polyketide biosynthesis zinc-dependent hydrolase PksB [Candidatus Omnitrophica bacterium ADurb.Bin277]|nr:MAG: putative polyketide biosynthesis zinc-dependent hydrolase PksB [Candidatus Omnitrophica bacterium ADurb.Bin277]